MRGSLQWDFERGLLTEEEFFAELRGRLQFSAEITREEFVRTGSDIFTLNASLIPVLDELRALGHRLVICLSNTSVSHFEFVQNGPDVLSRFDDFVLSFKVGAMKPGARIFEVAGMKMGYAPGAVLLHR